MSRITKIELMQANARLAADNHALRVQLADALFDLALYKDMSLGRVRVIKLPEHMQRAKDMAMSSGLTVKVG